MPFALRFTLDTSGLTKKAKAIDEAFRATPLLQEIGKAQVRFIRDVFRAQGSYQSIGGWKPLKPSTVAAKGFERILFHTGQLRDSFGWKVIPGARVQVGTDVEYAKYHEFGTRPYEIRPKTPSGVLSWISVEGRVFAKLVRHPGLPRRRFMPNKVEAHDTAVQAVRNYIFGKLEKI